MTTIACNATEMAADTRVSLQDGTDVRVFESVKIERVGDAIYGVAGDFQAGVRFMEWVRREMKGRKPRLCKDFAALKIDAEGIYSMDGPSDTWMKVSGKFDAIGSGRKVALGAMEMGASPADAVKAAKKWDAFTGGDTTVLRLNDEK